MLDQPSLPGLEHLPSRRPLSETQFARTPNYAQMSPKEFSEQPGTYWHSSSARDGLGMGHPGLTGIHVGTREAATQALNARIGTPGAQAWDGTRKYGDTHLVPGTRTGYSASAREGDKPKKPTGAATYSTGEKVPMSVRPNVTALRITGEMTNQRHDPTSDAAANGQMKGQLKKGNARRGYYYSNIGEDAGSISAVVPSRDHLSTHADFVRRAVAQGEEVPTDNLNHHGIVAAGRRVIGQQRRLF